MNHQFVLSLRFQEEKYINLLDISSLLYDIELSHDFGLILTEEEYRDYSLSQFFWYRKGRPIRDYHRIKAARISKQSPLDLSLVIASVGGIWALMQIIDKASNWRLDKKKRELEIEKLELEIREKKYQELSRTKDTFFHELQERHNAELTQHRLVSRIEELPFKLLDVDIEGTDKNKYEE